MNDTVHHHAIHFDVKCRLRIANATLRHDEVIILINRHHLHVVRGKKSLTVGTSLAVGANWVLNSFQREKFVIAR
jgi:hypothetical protein